MSHLTGTDRAQSLLLRGSLGDYLGQHNPVRFIGAFVEVSTSPTPSSPMSLPNRPEVRAMRRPT
jgi:hypothetical protein